jgi:soluble cytochrome b562
MVESSEDEEDDEEDKENLHPSFSNLSHHSQQEEEEEEEVEEEEEEEEDYRDGGDVAVEDLDKENEGKARSDQVQCASCLDETCICILRGKEDTRLSRQPMKTPC